MRRLRFLTIFLAGTMTLAAQNNYEPSSGKQSDGKTIPAVVKVDKKSVKVGEILVNHQDRTVSFPAKVNLSEGIIEYLVSMTSGKVHEALLITDADPLHLSVAMKLLKFTSHEKFFPQRDDDLNWLSFTPPEPKDYEGARVELAIEQIKDGKPVVLKLKDWLVNAGNKQGFEDHEWLYTNSWFYRGAYQASLSGDLIGIFADLSSVVNYIGDFNEGANDAAWVVNPQHKVPAGTDVRVIITQKDQAAAKDAPAPPSTEQAKEQKK